MNHDAARLAPALADRYRVEREQRAAPQLVMVLNWTNQLKDKMRPR